MNADQCGTPRPQHIHGIGVLLRESEAKGLVCEERLLRIDGCHNAYTSPCMERKDTSVVWDGRVPLGCDAAASRAISQSDRKNTTIMPDGALNVAPSHWKTMTGIRSVGS